MNPKLEAGKDLKIIMRSLTRTTEKNFSKRIEDWHKNYKDFLDDGVPLEGKKQNLQPLESCIILIQNYALHMPDRRDKYSWSTTV